MLKLKELNIPTFTFRHELPDEVRELGDGTATVFIEVEGKAGGNFNPVLMGGAEEIAVRAAVLDRQCEILEKKSEDDIEAADTAIRARVGNLKEISKSQYGLIYDACVTGWKTNILDHNSKPLVCDRDTFVALSEVKLSEIADFFEALVAKIGAVSKIVEDMDEGIEKN